MSRRWRFLIAVVFLATMLTGCGGTRATGKNSNLDKPKPIADQ